MDQEPDAAPLDELTNFAHSFTAEETEPEVKTDPEPEKVVEEVKTDPEPEKKDPEPEKTVVEEDENPFEVEKKEDAKPEDTKEPEKPASSDDWSRLRESRNKYKAAAEEKESILREKEAEVTELKVKAARTAELEEKLKVFDEQEKELAVARVESTREYKESIEAPLHAIGEQVEILVTSNEGDVSAVKRMLTEPDPAKQRTQLKEITSGWDEIDRLDLKKMAEDARTILDKQDAMRSNAHAAAKEQQGIAAKREAEQKELSKKEFTKATGDAVKSVREKTPFVPLIEGQTEDDHYASLEQKVAQVDFAAQTPRAQALAIASTFELARMVKQDALRVAEIASLKDALAKATSGKPSVDPKAAAVEEGEKDFFTEFGIKDPNSLLGTMG